MSKSFHFVLAISVVMAASMLLCPAVSHATIAVEGSVLPNPLHAGDGVVESEMELGVVFMSTGGVEVTDYDTLITRDGAILGYSVASTAYVNLFDSTWMSTSGVKVAHSAYTNADVHLVNSTWKIEGSTALAQGDDSVATVTLDANSLWITYYGAKVTQCAECLATINVNSGLWLSEARVLLGGEGFSNDDGTGVLNIAADGIFDSRYMLSMSSTGNIHFDGGQMLLAGETSLEGVLDATAAGGTIIVRVGEVAGGTGLVYVGDGADFTNCDIQIEFIDGLQPNPQTAYNVFDPLDGIDLATSLAAAASITTPLGWVLDTATGELSAFPFPPCVAGPEQEAPTDCISVYDYDLDNDVDLADFAEFQRRFVPQ